MLRPTKIVHKTCIIACKQITYLPKKWVMTPVQFKTLNISNRNNALRFSKCCICMHNSAECVKE